MINASKKNTLLIKIIFAIILGKIAYLQFVKGSELQSMAYVQQTLDRSVNPKRGTIYDATGKQILAVVNFSKKQIADFLSEVLVLGTYSKKGVILITPDRKATNGDKLG